MSRTAPSGGASGSGLLIPALESGPLPIQAIQPSPCTLACPAGVNVKAYVSLIAEGRFGEALEVVREQCPMPGICGRICPHPCEAACRRGEHDQPVAIRALKRFVADLELEPEPQAPPKPPDKSDRIAVIGSGPAGLTAAYDLRRAGYPVTVFEAAPLAGGMLRYGIADYRLPTDVLDAEIGVLERAGLEIVTGCRIGADRDLEELLKSGYSAVLIAVGAQRGRRLGLEGEESCDGIEDALAFLRRVNAGERPQLAGRVLVIGGGSTAIEAARTARRLGAEVEIVYRRHRGEMPADEEEIEMAEAEGIGLRLLTAPARLVAPEGRLEGLECLEVALGEPDASGRRRPVSIPGSEFVLPADRILAAIGQQGDFSLIPDRVLGRVAPGGRIEVDGGTGMTALRGVFAAGDAVSGPATVIDAVADGHRAAHAIRRFLEQGLETGEAVDAPLAGLELEIPSPPPVPEARRRPPHAGITPGREFDEVELAYSAASAIAEARRCLRCGPCSECRICAASCGRRHLSLWPTDDARRPAVVLRAPSAMVAAVGDGAPSGPWPARGFLVPSLASRPGDELDVASLAAVELAPLRVSIDEDLCRGCARCMEVCSFDAIWLLDPEAPETVARVDPLRCRGCNLCTAVCPTGAASAAALSIGSCGRRLQDLYAPLLAAPEPPLVVLTCQRQAPAVEALLALHGLDDQAARLVTLRCAGQLDAGMVLELYRHGAGRILLADCAARDCRYGGGPDLAAEQLRRAQAVLAALGLEARSLVASWDAVPEIPLAARPTATGAAAPGEGS